jgi:STE24 endopeptidase
VFDTLLIALVVVVALRDGLSGVPWFGAAPDWVIAAVMLGPPVLGSLLLVWRVRRCTIRLNATGQLRHADRAHRAAALLRSVTFAAHAAAVLGLDALGAVRTITGNLVLVDEAIVMLPALLALVVAHVAVYPIHARLREALLLRRLDEGGPIPGTPTFRAFAWDRVRHRVLFLLLPVTLIVGAGEALDRLAQHLMLQGWPEPGFWTSGSGQLTLAGAQLVSALAVLSIAPLFVRLLWDTVPLGDGPLRERLIGLCRAHGVRCRDVLVWRTSGELINGALVGLLPRLRYILLTDALLERLEPVEVEAVMAHEVAHARRRHIPWLIAGLLASVSLAWIAALELGALAWGGPAGPTDGTAARDSAGIVVALLAGVAVFGHLSRRFEEQADAFAVQHLSGVRTARRDAAASDDEEAEPNESADANSNEPAEERSPGPVRITAPAAEAMASALGQVARLNNIAMERFSFRHGSIGTRRRRLARLVGQPAARLPIDRRVRRLKLAIALGLVVLGGLTVWDVSRASPAPAPQPPPMDAEVWRQRVLDAWRHGLAEMEAVREAREASADDAETGGDDGGGEP